MYIEIRCYVRSILVQYIPYTKEAGPLSDGLLSGRRPCRELDIAPVGPWRVSPSAWDIIYGVLRIIVLIGRLGSRLTKEYLDVVGLAQRNRNDIYRLLLLLTTKVVSLIQDCNIRDELLSNCSLSYARNLFIEPATYGVGNPSPLRSLSDALHLISGGRDKLVFVHNGLVGGPIEQVINSVTESIHSRQDQVYRLSSESELQELCRTSLSGVSTCIAAAVFYSSPIEGPYGAWNYSIRTDAALGAGIDVDSHTNDQQLYLLPLQHSIDWAIGQANKRSIKMLFPMRS
ncbi:hypothetical protein BDV28DRAFT_120494 [Aspergillus coremiiformis]|uniref:Uncharacterized protein n=1 Tax=Aspergillus coremiiformis TaxID=138285 RepID=A0A5N6Z515_9EURO|nr:hypothetical protein BDV28DRAFT_120494 [Aspergillus coremiiformis]